MPQQRKIPKFKDDREAADFWDSHDSTDFIGQLREVPLEVDPALRQVVARRTQRSPNPDEERSAFVLRIAPSHVNRFQEAFQGGEIIIGWSEARGLLNPDLTWGQFRKIVHDQYYSDEPNFIRSGGAAGQLWRFIREMKPRDWVVVPHGSEFYVAEVTGPARHDEKKVEDDTAHRRPVVWLNAQKPIPRRIARAALQSRLKIQQSCVGAGDLVEEIADALQSALRADQPSFEQDLRQQLIERARTEIVSGRINERGFESLVAAVLESLGGSPVRVVPRNLDKGADILATFSIAGTFNVLLAVQVKHHRPRPLCGVEPLDELMRGMEAEGAHLGWVVTSGAYSEEALERARKLQEQGTRIELVDGEQLAAMIVEGGLRFGEGARK